jgi:hypothetical protein
MAKGSLKVIKWVIAGVAAVIVAAVPYLFNVFAGVTYTGRVRDAATDKFLKGVEVSIDARVPKTSYTDSQGIYSVSVRRSDLGRDVKLHFRVNGYEPNERSVTPTDERIEDIRLRPLGPGSPSPRNGGALRQEPAGRPTGRPATAPPVPPVLVNEGSRSSAQRAVLFVDSTGRVDANVTSQVASALGATDSLFTPAFTNQMFPSVQAGQIDPLRSMRLEHIGAIALGIVSTRTEDRNVNGAEFTEARAEIGVRVIYPARNFAAQLIAVEDRGTGFTPTSAAQSALDKAVAKAIGQLKAVF